jgi:non-specific serine/threonine protein kinase
LALSALGDTRRATDVHHEGLTLNRQLGIIEGLIFNIAGLAVIAERSGATEQAIRLFAATESLEEMIGAALSPRHTFPARPVFERSLAAARALLSEIAFAAAWDAGRALAIEAAVAEAMAVVPAPPSPALTASPDGSDSLGLTPREVEVLHLLAEGMSDREIAESLSISERTAGNHVQHVMQKIGVDSRTAAAVFAVRHAHA